MLSPLFQNLTSVEAYYSDRHGGVSQPPFNSFNLAFHVEDARENIEENRRRLLASFSGAKHLHAMHQIHSNIVCHVDEDNNGCDAIFTNKPNEVLMVMVADCIPLLFYDVKKRVIAAIHAGRAGVFSHIASKTIAKFEQAYGSNSADIYVAMGPSIDVCCYEVGDDIRKQLPSHYIQEKHIDIRSMLYDELVSQGIEANHIERIDRCTACNTQDFFSYRKEGKTGRFCAAIMLK